MRILLLAAGYATRMFNISEALTAPSRGRDNRLRVIANAVRTENAIIYYTEYIVPQALSG